MEVRRVVVFCDLCEAGDATGVAIEYDGRRSVVDLCRKCLDAKLGDLLKLSKPTVARTKRGEPLKFEEAKLLARE